MRYLFLLLQSLKFNVAYLFSVVCHSDYRRPKISQENVRVRVAVSVIKTKIDVCVCDSCENILFILYLSKVYRTSCRESVHTEITIPSRS